VTGTARRTRSAPDLAAVAATFGAIEANVTSIVAGKPDVVRLALVALLSEGHLLIEDVPGVGKTLLAKALARSIDCSVQRVQFTPDLLPSDVTGVTVYSPDTGEFEFKPGPVFANIVLGDEINRAGPKTQSALLEAMEERTVTIDGVTHLLACPSWSWRPRTRSSSRAPIPCPRRSATGS
jgi:MoxR-like ATPase